MRVQIRGQAAVLRLTEQLGAGGEARIYALPGRPDLVAKIYHQPEPAKVAKLGAMLACRPVEPDPTQPGVIWPVALVDRAPKRRPGDDAVVGFVMPRVDDMGAVFEVLNPSARRLHAPLFGWRHLVRAARNVAAVMARVHASGHVVGDLNESNVLVDDTARVALVDTDSFQVRDARSGALYRCPVGKPEYTAPELQGVRFRDVDQTPAHDHFALAVLIFQLLTEGTHPFAGIYRGADEPPSIEARIAAGLLPSTGSGSLTWMPAMPPISILGTTLLNLFDRCFRRGHHTPSLRPSAGEWVDALDGLERTLLDCAQNPQHAYGDHLQRCPWCERRDQLGGRDPFPSVAEVLRFAHLVPPPPPPPTALPRWRRVHRGDATPHHPGFRRRRGAPRKRRAAARAARSPTQRVTRRPTGASASATHTVFGPGKALLIGLVIAAVTAGVYMFIRPG